MDETEVAVKLEAQEQGIDSLKRRADDLETRSKVIQDLAISVNRMAVSIESMLQELDRQGNRLETLERVPAETGKVIKAAIITALSGGLIGAVVTAVLQSM